MGRLTLERSHIQEQSEGVLTAGVWGGGPSGAGIAPRLVGEKQGEMENKAQGEGTVAAVSQAERPPLLGGGRVLCLDSMSCGREISIRVVKKAAPK